jgi:hypothetical protein
MSAAGCSCPFDKDSERLFKCHCAVAQARCELMSVCASMVDHAYMVDYSGHLVRCSTVEMLLEQMEHPTCTNRWA